MYKRRGVLKRYTDSKSSQAVTDLIIVSAVILSLFLVLFIFAMDINNNSVSIQKRLYSQKETDMLSGNINTILISGDGAALSAYTPHKLKADTDYDLSVFPSVRRVHTIYTSIDHNRTYSSPILTTRISGNLTGLVGGTIKLVNNKGNISLNFTKENITGFIDTTPPVVSTTDPLNNSLAPVNNPSITAFLFDFESGVDPSSITMSVNNTIVPPVITPITNGYNVTYSGMNFSENDWVYATVNASDYTGNLMTYTWSFKIKEGAPQQPPDGYTNPASSLKILDTDGILRLHFNPGDTVVLRVDDSNLTDTANKNRFKMTDYQKNNIINPLDNGVNGPFIYQTGTTYRYEYNFTLSPSITPDYYYLTVDLKDSNGFLFHAYAIITVGDFNISHEHITYCDINYMIPCDTFNASDTIYVKLVGVNTSVDVSQSDVKITDQDKNKIVNTLVNVSPSTFLSQNGSTIKYYIDLSTSTWLSGSWWYSLRSDMYDYTGTHIFDAFKEVKIIN